MNASHDAYVTGSPALYSVFVQPTVVFLAILQLDVMRVARHMMRAPASKICQILFINAHHSMKEEAPKVQAAMV